LNKFKPNALLAWVHTFAAVINLFAFVITASSEAPKLSPLLFLGGSELLLLFLSIKMWKNYFEDYTKSMIQENSNGGTSKGNC
jgi:hypothetical protein